MKHIISDAVRSRLLSDSESFGIGGGCMPRQSPNMAPGETGTPPGLDCLGPVVLPGCVRPGRRCDTTKIGATKVVEGGTAFELEIEPRKVPWFKPSAVRAVITDLANTDLSHRVLFTAVEINDTPQEGQNDTRPVAPTAPGDVIDGWWSDDWIDPEGYAVPIPWGWISNRANVNLLKIYGIAIGLPVTTQLLVSVTVYGNGASSPRGMVPEKAALPTPMAPMTTSSMNY